MITSPPGYMDKSKSDPSGDFIVWKQLIREAGVRKLPTVFVTDDRKEDWYWREHGLTIGARHELRKEMTDEADVPFVIMTSDTFLVHAKNYLDVPVSSATVDQAKELRDNAELEQLSELEGALTARLDERISARRSLAREIDRLEYEVEKTDESLFSGVTEFGTIPPPGLRQKRDALMDQLSQLQQSGSMIDKEIMAIRADIQNVENALTHLGSLCS
jgi:PIN like domain